MVTTGLSLTQNCLVLKEFEVTQELELVSAYAKSYKNTCEAFKLKILTNVYSEGRGYSSGTYRSVRKNILHSRGTTN